MPKPPAKVPDSESRPAGGVRHDEQGNAVWQWASNTGRQAIESTSRLLRKLEVPGLKLLDDADEPGDHGAPSRPGDVPHAPRARGKEKKLDAYFSHAAAAKPAPKPKPAVSKAKKPSFLSRLFGRR